MNSVLLCTTALCLIISVFCQRFPAAYDNYDYPNRSKEPGNSFDELSQFRGMQDFKESDGTRNNKNQLQSCKNLISKKEFENKLENLVAVISHVCSDAEEKLMSLLSMIHLRMTNGEDLTKILQSISTNTSNQYDKAAAIKTYLNDLLGKHVMVTKELKCVLEKSTSTALKPTNSHVQCEHVATHKLANFVAGSLCKQSIYGSDFTTYADETQGGIGNLFGNLLGLVTGLVNQLLGVLDFGNSDSPAQQVPEQSDYNSLLRHRLDDRSNINKEQELRGHPQINHQGHNKKIHRRQKSGKNNSNHKNRKSNHKNHERSSHNKHHSRKHNRHGQSNHQHEEHRN